LRLLLRSSIRELVGVAFFLRAFFILLAVAAALAQSTPQILFSRTKEDLRGVSAVSQKVAWASGTHGTYLRMVDGHTWMPEQVPGAESLDFRGVVGFSAEEAFLMSSGPGEQSRIYHTADAGRHWELQFTNKNPKGFFDSMAFWDRTHGIVLGDSIPDESGKLKFELLLTEDGQTWHPIPPSLLPPAMEGEGAFAASNSCVAILTSVDPNIWFASGGTIARVFHSSDRGHTWEAFDTPIVHGADSEGIFSIAFRDALHGVIAGGDYKHPEEDGPNLAFTNDGGKTWTLSKIFPQSYYSDVAYDRSYATSNEARSGDKKREDQAGDRMFLIDPKFIYDFRPPRNPIRISSSKKYGLQFNAASSYPNGGALIVGPKGTIVTIP
jgi:photosystem II stability/assembly factor-like uncharacterized protein